MNQAIEIYKRARELLNQGWIKRNYAHDQEGWAVDELNPKACSFCAIGAIRKATDEKGFNRYTFEDEFQDTVRKIIVQSVRSFNDDPSTTKEEVIGLFDKVIEELESPFTAT